MLFLLRFLLADPIQQYGLELAVFPKVFDTDLEFIFVRQQETKAAKIVRV